MKYKIVISLLVAVITLTGCAELAKIAQQSMNNGLPLTTEEVIAGLKEALSVGTGKSVEKLAVTDGYYGDLAVKILLPPEADIIVKNISKIPGGNQLLEDVIVRINRAAEDAVKEAKPVFVSCITGMTFSDAWAILKGDKNAATQYFRKNTFDELFNLYQPKIKASIDKKIIGNISTDQSWKILTGKWNEMAKTPIGIIAGFKPVNVELDKYLTQKGLDGLFMKIEEQEKLIREDPVARITQLLKRVFGSQAAN